MPDGSIPGELKSAISGFQDTLTKIRQKQAEQDLAIKRGRGADPLVKAQIERMEADLNALHKKASRPHVAHAGFDGPSTLETKANQEVARWLGGDESKAASFRMQYKAAFNRYLRLTKDALTPDEIKTLSVGSSPDGGFFVEPFRAQTMINKLYETSEMRRVAPAIVISSKSYEEPIDRDEPSSGWVGEQSARPETATPQIGLLEIPVHEVYAMPKATQSILDDSGINVEQWIDTKVIDEFGRQENTAFVLGNGTSKPQGFTTYPVATTADASRAFGTLQYKFTGSNGAFRTASATVSPADDLLDLIYSFKAGYRKNLRWAGTRVTLGAVRKFKDQQGNYIYDPRLGANGIIDTVLGYEWHEFADMADFTTTDALGIALADWTRGYVIIDRQGVRQQRDPYTSKPYVLFYTTKRVGGAVRDSDAIKFLKFGTS